ncbi:hypothetical protein NDU88_005695 [Pleurodeles waltl]|uniref:Uncharacterized protein n=1 Tax=Pleurodeles waltl TaxID=8319 RepID=A0AAV7LD69_PLEWA|nr:hypothetical protein NDU88_005695 [Pleurodeles waltl]
MGPRRAPPVGLKMILTKLDSNFEKRKPTEAHFGTSSRGDVEHPLGQAVSQDVVGTVAPDAKLALKR